MSQNKPLVSAIDHCSLIVANTIKALDFYKDILGLEVDGSRPDLGVSRGLVTDSKWADSFA